MTSLSLLGIVFVTLKLTGHIEWSWWWVTVPFWGGGAVFFTCFLIGGAYYIWEGRKW